MITTIPELRRWARKRGFDLHIGFPLNCREIYAWRGNQLWGERLDGDKIPCNVQVNAKTKQQAIDMVACAICGAGEEVT